MPVIAPQKKTIKLRFDRPKLYPKQEAAVYDAHRIAVIEASTKSGKTSSCIIWLFEQALAGKKGWNYWWVAPILRQANIAFSRMQRALPQDLFTVHLGNHTIELINGTIIWFLGADNPDSLYGEDVHAAVVDEASRTKETAWHALYSTLTATGGPIRIIGNVKGRRNWFYEIARKAEQNLDPEFGYHKLVSDDAVAAGIFPESRVEAARKTLPEAVFRELYLAEPSDDQGNPFGFAAIKNCIRPLSKKLPQCWGWDFAKSHDWTVGIGLDEIGQTCRFERWQSPWEATNIRIHGLTGRTRALCDSTGVGDPVVERLQKNPGSHYEGFKFSQSSKQQLMEGLAVAIQSTNVFYPEGVITQELEAFEYEYTSSGVRYSAPEGYFDDTVVALALANHHRSHSKPSIHKLITKDILARSRMPPRQVIMTGWGKF
jgi:hypothetical protein